MDEPAKKRDRPLTEQVGARLAEERRKLGLSQTQLGEKLNLEKESISRIESGKIAISLARLSMFCDALDLSIENVLTDVSAHPSDQAKTLIASLKDLSPRQRAFVLKTAIDLAALLRDEDALSSRKHTT